MSRRLGLNLSGRAKDGYVKRPYAPGILDSQRKHRTGYSEYGTQLKEKQKVRFTYGIGEKQFHNYVKALPKLSASTKLNFQDTLKHVLESRLDNVVYRMGLSSSRAGARQIVNHAHILLNGKINNIPSALVSVGDVIQVKENSKGKRVFTVLAENVKDANYPAWLEVNFAKLEAKVKSLPQPQDFIFDLNKVLEYYSK